MWPGAEDKATWTEVASYTAGHKTRPQVQGFWSLKGVVRIGRFLEGGDVDLGLEGCQRFEHHIQKRWRWEVRGCHRKGEVCFGEKSKMLIECMFQENSAHGFLLVNRVW